MPSAKSRLANVGWKKRNKKYLAAFQVAEQIAADFMEDEIHRRAFDGIDHPLTYEGKITDTYKVYGVRKIETILVSLMGNVGLDYDGQRRLDRQNFGQRG